MRKIVYQKHLRKVRVCVMNHNYKFIVDVNLYEFSTRKKVKGAHLRDISECLQRHLMICV